MGLLNFFAGRTAGRKSLTGSASVLEALSQRQFSTYPALGGTNINTQRIGSAYVSVQNAAYGWIYLYQPSVRRVIDYIARNVAELGIKVYERVSDDEREHRGDHPAARALRNPNTHMSGNYFIQEFVKAHLTYGNAYALKFLGANGELTLEMVPPHRVGIIGQSAFSPDGYRIWRTDGTFRDFFPEQMVHWPATSGDDARRGESYLETLREALSADAAAQAAITEIHRSGLSLAGWLERPLEAPPIAPENLKRLQQDVANQMKNAKRHPPIFEEGMTYKTGGITPEDAELLAGRQFTLEYVASLYGMKNIPPVGEEERNQFYADVLPPLTTMCASFFDLSILQEEYGADDHYFEFNPEKLQAEWVKTLVSGSGRPVFTTNEARAKINLPPIDGGDELVTPLNVMVGDNPRPTPQTMPIPSPSEPPGYQDGGHRTGEADDKMVGVRAKGLLGSGERFGWWTVLASAGSNKHGQRVYDCECECGTRRTVVGQDLRNGHSKSCSQACSAKPEVSYEWMHGRLRNQRGIARDLPCVGCEQKAATWSFAKDRVPEDRWRWDKRGRPYSNDIEDYDPRCIGCHNTFDKRMNGNGNGKALLVPRRIQEDHRRDGWAKKYDNRMKLFLSRQEQATKSKKVQTVTDERWNKELAQDLDELYVQHFATEGGHASFRWASSFDPEQGRNWLKAKAAEIAIAVNAVTQAHIERDGEEQAFTHAKGVRAVALGMSMATDVASFAVKVAEEQAPGDREVTIDGGTCEVCLPHQGTFLAKDLEAWPAFHPGCQCVCDPS